MDVATLKIFVVEDDEWYNRLLRHNLSLDPDYEVHSFSNANDCIANLNLNPDVITLDYRLPDMKGVEVLKQIKAFNSEIQVIAISEQEDIEVVVELFKHGAYDYIVKSNDIRERLLNTVNNIRTGYTLKNEIRQLRTEVQKKYAYSNSLIGNSKAILNTFELIDKAIRTNITVTINGETGTGKELVAKAIHYHSNRADQSFVAVNVAAIPKDLIESELFGFEKGAFTGAVTRRVGKFEEANKGTLFLDEIGEMDLTMQTKLLRVLQEREVVRLGSNDSIKFDCRVIIATNRNLQKEVKDGNFRKDLYYRLYGLQIELAPLRERENDFIILSKFFIDSFCTENNIQPKKLNQKAIDKLRNYTFPGNIRELKSIIELAVTLCDDDEILSEHIIIGGDDLMPELLSSELTMREYNRKIVDSFLKKYNNNTKLVAEKLDVGVATIYRMLKE